MALGRASLKRGRRHDRPWSLPERTRRRCWAHGERVEADCAAARMTGSTEERFTKILARRRRPLDVDARPALNALADFSTGLCALSIPAPPARLRNRELNPPMNLITDFRFALRSLDRVKGLVATVVVTLALGIGAHAAIFSVVRGVLLRPLVNRDQDRLIYLHQSARGIGVENAKFSIPELRDLQARVKTLTAFGDFSTIDFTMVGLGEPRVVRAGVVGGSYFEVMGLRAERGRLLDATDDGPRAAGAAVLTHRFWATTLQSDPSVIGKSIRLGDRSATIVGVLEPCVPYPTETEIIANVVTSPHHLDATMVEGRVHRMTDLFGRLAPGVELEAALAELRTVHGAIVRQHPEAYTRQADFRIEAVRLRDQIVSPARTILLVLLAASALVFIVACSNVANLILARSVRREGELRSEERR